MSALIPLWAPGAALQYGVGKHYPGEQTPRWALNATWRADGVPVWTDPALLADPDTRGGDATQAHAEAFVRALAAQLHVPGEAVLHAYEDQPYWLMREARMPANIVAEAAQARDPLERARIMRVFSQGSTRRWRAYCRCAAGVPRAWQTEVWAMREDKLFLVPGDSSAGVRLPLASLPWVDPKEIEEDPELDPFEKQGPLPPLHAVPGGLSRGVRTALTIEARGRPALYLSTPAGSGGGLAGAGRPQSRRWRGRRRGRWCWRGIRTRMTAGCWVFSITPDPGVIEVNIHPATGWDDLVARTTALYHEGAAGGADGAEIHARRPGTWALAAATTW